MCILLLPNKEAEFFDSNGGGPRTQEIVDYLEGWDIVSSQKQVQSPISTTCGQHCIYFAFHRARGVPFKCIMDSYSLDLAANDQMVCEFVEDNFGFQCDPIDEDMLYMQIARALR